MQKRDFFISYTASDEKWATWIAGTLEENGSTTYMQAWDFKAGENFVLNMHEALENCDKFIAVLSAEYMEKVYCQAEWTAAFTKDPSGEKGLFIPIRIEEIKPEGLFAPIIYIDLFGVDKEEAEKRLMQINETDIARNKPGFPGTKKAKFPGQLPLNNIPYTKNIHFIGRKEILNELKNSLKPGENNPYSFVLCGMGAVGKTQITLAYALNNGYLYDTIWWVNAETEVTVLNSYRDLLVEKGIIKKDVAYERDKVLQSVWRWMSNNPNWLFIYDNAESEKELAQYLPRVNTGHILITTRNKNWRNVQKIEVDVFQPQEAVEFFNSFKIEGSFNDANDLGKGLGYLPLALDQAAAYIIENNISYQEYLELYIKYQLEMFGESEFKPIFYEQTVATTWQISLAKIDNESAKQLIGLIAFLAPDNIQTDIFLQSSEYLPEPLASAVKHELKFKKTIKVLTQYSLIKSEKDRMSIHLLLQKVIRQSLKEEQARYFHACVNILYHLFTYNQYDAKTWENCAQLLPHVQSVLLCEQNGLKTETEEIAGLYANGGGWLLHTALYQKALEWNKKALSIREKVLGSDHLDTAMTCCNRAGIYYNLGEYKKALEWNKKGVEVFQKVYGPDNIVVATIYVNIASIYHSQGKYKKAMKELEKTLKIQEKVLGSDDLHTALTYNNIAGIYHEIGEYDKAQEWYGKALKVYIKQLGADHLKTAMTYSNIAGVYYCKKEYDKALKWNKEALTIRLRVLGLNHPETAISYNNIASIYKCQGDYKTALAWSEKALVVFEKVLGPDHPDTAAVCNNIGETYSCQGNYKTALKWYKKALAVQEKVLGSDHPDMATTYNNIASIYNSQGDYPTALEWYKKVLAIREKVLGPEHTDMGILYNSIGYIYGCQSEYKTALAWLEKALAVFEKVLGSDHPDTVTVYNNITMVNKMIKSQHNDSK